MAAAAYTAASSDRLMMKLEASIGPEVQCDTQVLRRSECGYGSCSNGNNDSLVKAVDLGRKSDLPLEQKWLREQSVRPEQRPEFVS